MSTLIQHPQGNYRFLPGGAPYSSGVLADVGFEIVHVTLRQAVAWRDGFALVDQFLARQDCPRVALCAMELRSPRPFTLQGFSEFNEAYCRVLKEWDVYVDGANPIARTNVCPIGNDAAESTLYAFSFVRRASGLAQPTFVVAGAGELQSSALSRDSIVRVGETSVDAMAEKARCVCGIMEKRLSALGGTWNDVSTVNAYTIHPLQPHMEGLLLAHMPVAARHGVHWHFARPPVVDIEFELDLRGTATELTV